MKSLYKGTCSLMSIGDWFNPKFPFVDLIWWLYMHVNVCKGLIIGPMNIVNLNLVIRRIIHDVATEQTLFICNEYLLLVEAAH